MEDLIMKIAAEFNEYSELVALNLEQIKEGKCDEGTHQWHRGRLDCLEDYLKLLASVTSVKQLE